MDNDTDEDRGDERDVAAEWSVWGVRLLAALGVALLVVLAWAWVDRFYRDARISQQLSFFVQDGPYMPPHTSAKPILGLHYFGDFQLPRANAINLRHNLSPYLGDRPTQYPPLSVALFVPLSFGPLKLSAFVYLALNAFVFLLPLWLLLAPMDYAYRAIFLVPAAVLTTPFASMIDRGNNIGLTAGLIAWAVWAWRREKWFLCGAVLVAAIGLKAYPIALLLVPLALRRYKFTAAVAASAIGANLVSLLFYPGGFLENVRAVPSALTSAEHTAAEKLATWSLWSIVPKTGGLLFGNDAIEGLLDARALTWLPALLYAAGIFVVVRRNRVPQWCWGPLALATIQLLVPISFVYTTAWASLAAVWYAQGALVPTDEPATSDSDFVVLRVILLLALTASLTPSVFTLGGVEGFRVPFTMYLSPLLLLTTLVVAVIQSFERKPALQEPVPARIS